MSTRDELAQRADEMAVTASSYDINAGISADVEPAVAAAAGLRLMGYSARESAGTPAVATFNIIVGATVAGGSAIWTVELAADASDHEWFPPAGIDAAAGLSIEVVAGTVDVILYYKTVV